MAKIDPYHLPAPEPRQANIKRPNFKAQLEGVCVEFNDGAKARDMIKLLTCDQGLQYRVDTDQTEQKTGRHILGFRQCPSRLR